MDFALEAAYQEFARFAYTSFDRLVIRGYERMLQMPAGFVTWARRMIPDQPITSSWIASLARRFRKGVKRFAEEREIAILLAPKGQRKHEVAEQYRERLKPDSGVYLIIRGRERTWGFESRDSKFADTPHHRNLFRRERCVDHYYFYLIDKYWGPMSLKLCSHPPFNVVVFLNGNRWLAREAKHRGLSVGSMGNSIVRCAHPQVLQEIAGSLDWRRIQSVCDHWAYRLLPALTRDERRQSGFFYRWSFIQAEMSHNLVFKSPRRLTEILERHVDRNRCSLQPYSLKTIFTGRRSGTCKPDIDVSIRHAFGGLTVLKARYGRTTLKQYNNHRRTFRTEACTNHTPDVGVKKSIQNLNALRRRLLGLMAAFQAAQTPVLATTVHRGELAALAEPGRVNNLPTAGIRLENERILSVLCTLPQLVHEPKGFRSAELRTLMEGALKTPYSQSQAIYDLRKLRGKGLVKRRPGRRLYRATPEGLRVAALVKKLCEGLLEPLLTMRQRRRRRRGKRQPPPDCHYLALEEHLDQLCDFLGLRPAA